LRSLWSAPALAISLVIKARPFSLLDGPIIKSACTTEKENDLLSFLQQLDHHHHHDHPFEVTLSFLS
jgi:hypothetical protein